MLTSLNATITALSFRNLSLSFGEYVISISWKGQIYKKGDNSYYFPYIGGGFKFKATGGKKADLLISLIRNAETKFNQDKDFFSLLRVFLLYIIMFFYHFF